MSEFFKALEQAERDRQLAERSEHGTPPAGTGEREPSDADTENEVVRAFLTPPAPTSAPVTVAQDVKPPAPSAPEEAPRTRLFDRPPAVAEERVVERSASPPLVGERPTPATEAEPAPVEPAALRGKPLPSRAKLLKTGPVLIADLDPRSVAAEAYRTLRANLEFIPSERGCRHIVVTSPGMEEGKSTTVANLAVVAAQAGSRVCIVDADMRRPSLHRVFGVPNRGGFTRALSQAMPLASVAMPTDVPNLSLVVAGSSDGLRPAQLLNAPRLQKVLHDPATSFDLVLFDTPPVISVADAMNLAAHCDGVLLVVRAGTVPPSVLQQAVRQIDQVRGKVLGIVLNRVDLRDGNAEFYRYYRAYYASARKD